MPNSTEQTEVTIPERTNGINLKNALEEGKENKCHIPIDWKLFFIMCAYNLQNWTLARAAVEWQSNEKKEIKYLQMYVI